MSTIHSWRMEDHLKLMHTGGPCWICSLEKWALWVLGPYGRPKLFAGISVIHQPSPSLFQVTPWFWYVFGRRWGRVRSEKSNVSNFILISFWPYWTLPISGMLPWGPARQKTIDRCGYKTLHTSGHTYRKCLLHKSPTSGIIDQFTYIDPVKVLKYLQVELGTWNVKMGSFNQA